MARVLVIDDEPRIVDFPLARTYAEPYDLVVLDKEVRGCEFDPRTNVVDVGIRRLRCKLGAEVVATIRNVGYALEAA